MENYVTDKRTRNGAPKGKKMIATIWEKKKKKERRVKRNSKEAKFYKKFKRTKPNKLIKKLYKADSLFFLFVLLKTSTKE